MVKDCHSYSTRWILLETPRPEELVVAAARIQIVQDVKTKFAVIDIFGAVDSTPIKRILLSRLEMICASQGCIKVVWDIPSWSEDTFGWLSQCGYVDLGNSALFQNHDITAPV